MPLLRVQRYVTGDMVGGTIVSSSNFDATAAFTIEMRNPPFTSAGTWTLATWTGSFLGSISNITLDTTGLGFTASNLRIDGNSLKVDLA